MEGEWRFFTKIGSTREIYEAGVRRSDVSTRNWTEPRQSRPFRPFPEILLVAMFRPAQGPKKKVTRLLQPSKGGYSMLIQPTPTSPSGRAFPCLEAPIGPQDAGRFLNMHTKTVLRKARLGTLPAHPVGSNRKRWRFYLSELDDWLRSQVTAGTRLHRAEEGTTVAHRGQP